MNQNIFIAEGTQNHHGRGNVYSCSCCCCESSLMLPVFFFSTILLCRRREYLWSRRGRRPLQKICLSQVQWSNSILKVKHTLKDVLLDSDHAYMHKLTHLHAWQFFMHADRFHPLIGRPRDGKVKASLHCKHDYLNRLFFAWNGLMMLIFFTLKKLKRGGVSHQSTRTPIIYYRPLLKAWTISYSGLMWINRENWRAHMLGSLMVSLVFLM
jgi:hypothetical protein